MSLTKLDLPQGVQNLGVLNLIGGGLLFSLGDVWYVDSNNGSDGNDGREPDAPLATINQANTNAADSNDDVVVVAPNHTETVDSAGALTLDTVGLKVIGMGSGDDRPQIDFTSATGADMNVDGNDITMVNFRFTGNIDALTGPIDVNSDNFTLFGSQYEDVTGQTIDTIVCTGNNFTLRDWHHYGASGAGAQSAVQLNGTANAHISDFWIDGNFGTGAIESVTSNNTNMRIWGGATGGFVRTRNSTDKAIVLQSTDTGHIGPNLYFRLADDAANITEAMDSGSNCHFYDPIYVVNADDERGLQWNGTQSTDAA